MSIHNSIIRKITNYVIENTSEKTDDDIDILKYGIEVLVMNISKLVIIYLLAFVFGYLIETLLVTIVFGFIRRFASGLHVKGFFKCLIFSIIIFVFIITSSRVFEINDMLKIFISIIVTIGIFKYSPSDTEDKPYLDANNRMKLKKKATLISLLYSLIWISSFLGSYSSYFMPTLIAQLLLIHPLTYRLLGRRYDNYLYEDEYM